MTQRSVLTPCRHCRHLAASTFLAPMAFDETQNRDVIGVLTTGHPDAAASAGAAQTVEVSGGRQPAPTAAAPDTPPTPGDQSEATCKCCAFMC